MVSIRLRRVNGGYEIAGPQGPRARLIQRSAHKIGAQLAQMQRTYRAFKNAALAVGSAYGVGKYVGRKVYDTFSKKEPESSALVVADKKKYFPKKKKSVAKKKKSVAKKKFYAKKH